MRHNKHTGNGQPSILATNSPRKLAGSRRNKRRGYNVKLARNTLEFWKTRKYLSEYFKSQRPDKDFLARFANNLQLVIDAQPKVVERKYSRAYVHQLGVYENPTPR